MSEPETDIVTGTVMEETSKAILLLDDDEERTAWFPLSEITFKMRNKITGRATVEIPLWLLKVKGWE